MIAVKKLHHYDKKIEDLEWFGIPTESDDKFLGKYHSHAKNHPVRETLESRRSLMSSDTDHLEIEVTTESDRVHSPPTARRNREPDIFTANKKLNKNFSTFSASQIFDQNKLVTEAVSDLRDRKHRRFRSL